MSQVYPESLFYSLQVEGFEPAIPFLYLLFKNNRKSLTSIDNWGKYYSNAHLINDSKIIFNQIMKESDRMSATGNGKQSRRRRAVTCADRPNFACVNGKFIFSVI